ELVGASSSTSEWQRSWIRFIEDRCAIDAVAYGTAHGTMASYRCTLTGDPPSRRAAAAGPRIVGGATEYRIGECVARHPAAELAVRRWFPRERAFRATAPQVRMLVYSEAPQTDFVISSLDIYRLQPAAGAPPR